MYARRVKPALDRLGAAVLLVVFLPVLLVVAVLVRVSLGPGILYRQQRVGQGGEPFQMLKFRTMHPDRRRVDRPVRGPDRRRTHKTDADPRHTRVGRLLRRYSLDELPQLWNVLRGELSLVGPRPELVSVVRRHYRPWQHARHEVKPGLTGLWQVTQRDDHGQMYRHVDIDLRYIAHLDWRTDLAILLMTVPVLFHVEAPDVFGLRRLGLDDAPRGDAAAHPALEAVPVPAVARPRRRRHDEDETALSA